MKKDIVNIKELESVAPNAYLTLMHLYEALSENEVIYYLLKKNNPELAETRPMLQLRNLVITKERLFKPAGNEYISFELKTFEEIRGNK